MLTLYYFTWDEVASSLHSLLYVPAGRVLLYSGVILGASTVFAISTYLLTPAKLEIRQRQNLTGLIVLILLLGIGLDVAHGRGPLHGDVAQNSVHVMRSPVLSLVMHLRFIGSTRPKSLNFEHVESAVALSNLALDGSRNRPHIVLIVAEAFGLPREQSILNRIELPYEDPDLQRRYKIRKGLFHLEVVPSTEKCGSCVRTD